LQTTPDCALLQAASCPHTLAARTGNRLPRTAWLSVFWGLWLGGLVEVVEELWQGCWCRLCRACGRGSSCRFCSNCGESCLPKASLLNWGDHSIGLRGSWQLPTSYSVPTRQTLWVGWGGLGDGSGFCHHCTQAVQKIRRHRTVLGIQVGSCKNNEVAASIPPSGVSQLHWEVHILPLLIHYKWIQVTGLRRHDPVQLTIQFHEQNLLLPVHVVHWVETVPQYVSTRSHRAKSQIHKLITFNASVEFLP
jgi:hypothetical protein